MVAFVSCQPEDPLFQDRVSAVPQGDGEAKKLVLVA